MAKDGDKERVLKAARERQLPTYKRAPIDCQPISQQKYTRPGGLAQNIQSEEKQGPTTKTDIPSKAIT